MRACLGFGGGAWLWCAAALAGAPEGGEGVWSVGEAATATCGMRRVGASAHTPTRSHAVAVVRVGWPSPVAWGGVCVCVCRLRQRYAGCLSPGG